MKIHMGSFHVYDALSIFFQLEKPLLEHLEGFILLLRDGGKVQKNSKLLTENSSSRTEKNSSIGSTKASASMVGGMFVVTTMTC